MRTSRRLIGLVLFLALPASVMAGRGRPEPIPCPSDVAAALAVSCPCDAAVNHGQYVRCVAQFRNLLRRSGCMTEEARTTMRCAAHSTCGRRSAVVCCRPWRMRAVVVEEFRCVAMGAVVMGAGSACQSCVESTTTTSSSSSTSSTSTSSTSTSSTTSTTVALGSTYGNMVEYPTASTHAPDYLLGDPVMVTATSMLSHLCVIGKAVGANVVLGLYSSNAMGEPNQLVASTPATAMGMGAIEIPVAPTMLPPGQYWMFGVYDADASIGIDETDPTAPVRYQELPFSATLPQPFGPAANYTGQRFNYYIRVQ
jgi:hypothetical protein